MIIFIQLLLAHLIGDFILQPTAWVSDKENKRYRSIYFYIHILLHGILACALIGTINFIWWGLILAVLHGLIDFVKLYFQTASSKRNWFIIDQVLHLLVIAGIAIFYSGKTFEFIRFSNTVWIIITGLVLVTKPASVLIRIIISIWAPEDKNQDNSLQNAGNYIGMLERLFVFCFILTGHFEAIGFLLGAKSIFRFGDLQEAKDRKLTEYVLIGTLLSFGIAILTGLLVQSGLLQLF
jgi:nitrate reductase NapE component